MKIIELKDVKQKFANARELCPGMSDEIYAITDYISNVANDELFPAGLALNIALIIADLKSEKSGFNGNALLDSYLIEHKNQIMLQLEYIPQVVDVLADERFALEFRKICMENFGFNPPKRVNANIGTDYPEYVLVAADWWINQIQSPKFDNGMDIPAFLLMSLTKGTKNYTEEEINKFKEGLAKEILYKVQNYGCCYLSVDYGPCETFSRIEDETGVKISSYPWKTSMNVLEDYIEVYQSGDRKIIWEQKNNELNQKK